MSVAAPAEAPALGAADRAILSQALVAIAREMGAKLVRSAYSTVLREARDGSAALLDARGNTVAQAELIPMHLGSIDRTFRACAEVHGLDALGPDDFFIVNDPYSGGQHLQDVFIYQPIFAEGGLIGFAAAIAHHIDLSGGAAGVNLAAQDLYGEGLIIPPLKLNLKRDWIDGPFRRLLRANMRVPRLTMGDFEAQFAANAIAIARIRDLAARYGEGKVAAAMDWLQDYSETRMRAGIAACPDGVYVGEEALDGFGDERGPITVRATVTVAGDQVAIDFTGTDPQLDNTFNAPFASTVSAALSCVKAVLTSADIPFNAGAGRPVEVTAPLGCALNPRAPAPVRSRMEICLRVWNAVMRALAQAVPERVIACGFDTTTASALSWLGPDGWSVHMDVLGGGYGASAEVDGCDAVDCPLSNCSNTPVEALDADFPYFRVIGYALRPDSAGEGRHRGGLGFERAYEALRDDVRFVFYSDRFVRPAGGLFGGGAGATGYCRLERDGEVTELGARVSIALKRGDVVRVGLGGGGGYGDPAERPARAREADLADGLITAR